MGNLNQTYISFFGEISYTSSKETEGTFLENEIFSNTGNPLSDNGSSASYQYEEDGSLTVATYYEKWNGEEWDTQSTVYYGCTRLNMGAAPFQMVGEDEVAPLFNVRADFASW